MGRSLAQCVVAITEQLGHPPPEDFLPQLARQTRAALRQSLKPVAGIELVLKALTTLTAPRAPPLPFCVASNGNRAQMIFTLGLTGLAARFEGRMYCAEDVARPKPAPDLFLHAARLNALNPGAAPSSRTRPPLELIEKLQLRRARFFLGELVGAMMGQPLLGQEWAQSVREMAFEPGSALGGTEGVPRRGLRFNCRGHGRDDPDAAPHFQSRNDRRWCQRRPGAEKRRHRRGDGHHWHRGDARGRHHGAHRLQLCHHRRRGQRGATPSSTTSSSLFGLSCPRTLARS